MRQSVLLTGHKGFIGSNLKTRLESNGIDVVCFNGDITSFENVFDQVEKSSFTAIYHLAAISSVPICNSTPDKAFNVNVTGTFNILESLKRAKKSIHFIFPSTSHVYGSPKGADRIEIDEDFPLNPSSVYAHTKVASEKLIEDYFKGESIGKATILRLFNHTHHTQDGPFFFPQLYKQILSADQNNNIIKTGNLELYRDFSSVSSLIKKLILSLETLPVTNFEIFNVCSSQPRKLKDLATELSRQLGKKVKFHTDESLLRNDEPISIIGSSKKLESHLKISQDSKSTAEFIEDFLSN